MAAGYDWEGAHRAGEYHGESEAWKLRWWILLAVLLSIFVHVVLFFVFQIVRVSRDAAPIRSIIINDRPMRVERVHIDPAQLEDIVLPPEGAPDAPPDKPPEQVTQDSFVDESLDLLAAQEQMANLSEQDIVATPGVAAIENVGLPPDLAPTAEEAPTEELDALVDQLNDSAADAMKRELDSVREDLLNQPQVSESQAVMAVAEANDALSEESDALLRSLTDEQTGNADNVRQGVPDGYASLDELLRYEGPNVDLSKPILMPTDLLFDYNEWTLREEAKLSLMKLGFLIQKNPGSTFVIEGHTDSFGSEGYNLDLSQKRAAAVRDWLVQSLQLSPDQLRVRGVGEGRPLVDPNGSVEAQALNRRVEIVVLKGGDDSA